MKKFAIAVSILSFASGAAMAADLPVKTVAPPPPVFSWTGFYIGAHVGGALGTKEWDAISGSSVNTANNTTTLLFFPNASASHTVSGYLGGVQGGFNYQFNSIVAGIEAQGSWSNLAGRGNCFQDRAPIANISLDQLC